MRIIKNESKFDFADPVFSSGLADLVKKQMTPSSDWSEMARAAHFVQFYEADRYIVNSAAEYISHGLKAGETCIIIATEDRQDAIERSVNAFGQDLASARLSRSFISLETSAVLAKVMTGDKVDFCLCADLCNSLFTQVSGGRRVRVFDELVAVLLVNGNASAAIEIEAIWNGLQAKYRFTLFCAYPIDAFADQDVSGFMSQVCDCHSQVIPGESYAALSTPDERLRAISLLQQRGLQLEAENLRLRDAIF